jgi:diguanylate cyclase (GGDEF)-like protein/PAS domain S-box-containing protein
MYAGRMMIYGVERNLAMSEMRQVAREIDSEGKTIDSIARDWGSWDLAVRFARGDYPRFVEENIAPETLSSLDSDAMLVTDARGRRLYEAFSPDLTASPLAVSAIRRALTPGGELLIGRGANPRAGRSSVLSSGDDAVLAASRPIVASSEKGPVYGTITFVRLLDESAAARLSTVSGVKLKALAPGDASIPPDVAQALKSAHQSSPIVISVRRPMDITAYLRLNDHSGLPALVYAATIEAADYDLGMRIIAALVGVMLIGGVLWTFVAFWVVDTTSLSRLTWLRDWMARIAEGRALNRRIVLCEGEADEAASVAVEVNAMLDAISESHDRIRESEELHRVLVENMPDALFTLAPEGFFTFVNPEAERLTGIPCDQLIGVSYTSVLAEESVAAVAARMADPFGEGPRTIPVVFVDRQDRSLPAELSIAPVQYQEDGPVSITWIARDITERRAFEDQLVYLAGHDHLTGLFNRRRFEEDISQRLAEVKRRGGSGALIWVDLDNFKAINDSFGHRVGDELLQEVAHVLRDRSREEDILARLGGDEFAMLLPGASQEEAVQAAERVLLELTTIQVRSGEHPLRVGASAGVALYPEHGDEVDDLLLKADIAMYGAKEDGRNRVVLYCPDEAWPQRIRVRREWAEKVEQALANDSLVQYAQPIMDVQTGRTVAYELLVRMLAPDGTAIPPGVFLPIAEDLGHITAIDRVMVRKMMELASTTEFRASGLRLYVNLSAKSIADSSLETYILECMEESGVKPEQIGFELTETALVANMTRARDLVAKFRGMGCGFALDDFGTGFSSITYLRQLPVDVLKVGGGLVSEMLVSEQDRHLVFAIVDLARCLNIAVTAEYVEDVRILNMLKECGATYAQGYYIGMPAPVTQVIPGARIPLGVGR